MMKSKYRFIRGLSHECDAVSNSDYEYDYLSSSTYSLINVYSYLNLQTTNMMWIKGISKPKKVTK